MNILLTSIFIIGFSMLPALSHATPNSYYVTQNGNGARSGKSLENAWSVSDFNSAANWSVTDSSNKIDPGDTVYFSGTISTEVQPKGGGSPGNVITLDGYEAGDCDPINAVCSSSVLLTDGFWLKDGHDYITIQDIRATGGPSDRACVYINDLFSTAKSDHITIQRSYIYNTNGEMLRFQRTARPYDGSDYVTVSNNKMAGYSKDLPKAETGVEFYYTSNVIIRNNEFAGEGSTTANSDSVVSFNVVDNVLMEYNDVHDAYVQAGIAVTKEPDPGCHNMIVRFNNVHHNGDSTQGRGMFIGWKTSNNIYVYGNNIYSNGNFGLDVSDGIEDVYIWSNLIHSHIGLGISLWYRPSTAKSVNNLNIINNTFSNNASDPGGASETAIRLGDSGATNITVKNNIFLKNRPNDASNFVQLFISSELIGDVDLEHNTYHYPGQTPTIYYDSRYRTLTTLQSRYNLEDDATKGAVEDPGIINPKYADNTYRTADDDYHLSGLYINFGVDLSQCFDVSVQGKNYHMCYDDGLDPYATNWRTIPPTVRTTKRDHNAWVRGAYVYRTGNSSSATSPPSGLKIIKFKVK